jgi:hypothetical protein
MAQSNLLLDERHRVIRERLAVDGRVLAKPQFGDPWIASLRSQ